MEIVPQRDAITDSATNEVAPIILSVQEPDSADIQEVSDSAPLPDTKTPTEEKEPAIAPETTEPVKTVTASAPIAVTPPLIRQSTVPSSYNAASIHSQLSAAIGSAQQISTKTVTPSTSLGLIGANSMSAVTNPVANRPPPAVVSIPPPQARRPTSTSPPATPPLLNIPSSNASASLSGDTPLISSIATSMSPSIALLSSTLSSQNDFSYSGIPASPPLQSPRPVTGAPPPPLLPTRSSSESQISLPRYPSAPHNLSSTATPRSNSMTSSMSTSSLLSSSLWPGSTAPDATYLTHKSVPDRSAFTHVTSNPSFTAAAQSKSTASDAKSESSSKNNKDRLLTKSLSASNISSSFQGDVGGQLMLSSLGNVRGQARTQSISSARSAAQSPLPVNSTNAPEGKKSSNTPIQSTPRQSPSSNKERGDESVPVLHRRREIATTKLLAMERKSLLSRQGAPFVAPRLKSHWDYMMEEMQWLTIDFRQERRWAKSHCKTKAAMCANFLSLKNLNDNNGQWKDSMIYPPPTPSIQYEYWVQHLERCRDTSATVESRRVSSQLAFLVQEFWSVNTELAHTIDAAPLSMSELPKPINRTVEEFNKLVLETKENLMTICKPALEVSKLISPRLELTHGQLNALASCVAITARGYGVALRGESSSGKTVVAVALLRCWLQENAEPLLLITVKSRAHRWKYEFERVNDDNDIVIFSVHGCPRPHARVVVIYAEDLASTHGQIVKQFIDSRNWGGVMIDMRIHSRHSMITDNLFSVFHDISAAVTRCSGRRAVLWYKHAAMAGISVELLRFLLPSVFTSVQLVDKWKVWYTREHSGARTADAIIMEDLLANLYVVLGKVLVPLTPGTNKESERKAPTHSVCTKRYDVDASKVDLTPDQRRKYCSVVSMCAPWLCGDNMMLFVQAVMLLQRVCFHSDMLHVSYTSDSDDNRASPTNLYPSFSGDPIGTPREYMQLAMDMRSSPTAVSPGIVSHRLTAGASIESMSPGQEMKSPKLEALVDMIRNAKKSRIIVLADTLEQQLLAHQYLSKSNIEHLHGGIDTTLEDSWAYFYASEQAVIEFNRLVESGAHNEKSTQVIVLSEKYYEFERSSSISPINVDLIIVLSQNWLIQPELEPFMFDTRNEELRVTKVVYIVSRNSFEEVIFHAEKALIKFYNSLCCMDEKNVALSPLAILQGKALSELQLSMHMSRTANFQSLFLGSISSLCPSLCPMLKELFRSNDAYTSSDSSPSDSTLGSNLLLGKGRGKGALTRAPDGSVVAAPTSPPVDTNLRWLQRACVALELSCYMFSNMWGYTLHPHDAPPFTSYQEGKNSSVSPPPTQSLGVLFIGPSVALPADDSSLLLANYFKPTLEYQRLVSLHLEKQDPVVTADDDLLHKLFWNFHKKLSASRRSFTLCDNLDIGLLGYLANTVYETQENAVNNFENASVKPRTVYEDAVDMLYAPNVEGIDIASRHHDIVTQLQRTGDQVDRNLLVSPLSVASGQDVLTMPSWMTKSSSMETIFSIKYNTKSTKSKKQKQPKSEPKRKSTVTSNELHVTAVHLNSILPGDRFKAQMQQGTVRNDISAVNPYETKLYERPRPRGLSVAHVEYPPGTRYFLMLFTISRRTRSHTE